MRHAGGMHLPGPLRAAVGLAATAATEAKHLPDRAIELPMLVISSALQASLRAQQRYARLTARGDEVLNRRTPTPEPPPWATFDDPVDGAGRSGFEQLFAVKDPTLDPAGREPVDEILAPDEPPVVAPSPATSSATSPATPTVVQAVARKQAAKKAAKKVATKTAVKQAAKKTAKKTAGDPVVARAKTVSTPKHTPPSAFDNVTDS